MKFPGGMDIQKMMKEAQKMQEKMAKEMEDLRVDATGPRTSSGPSPSRASGACARRPDRGSARFPATRPNPRAQGVGW